MCGPSNAKSCSIVTLVASALILVGMIVAVGVFNGMFGPTLQCYVDAVAEDHSAGDDHDHSDDHDHDHHHDHDRRVLQGGRTQRLKLDALKRLEAGLGLHGLQAAPALDSAPLQGHAHEARRRLFGDETGSFTILSGSCTTQTTAAGGNCVRSPNYPNDYDPVYDGLAGELCRFQPLQDSQYLDVRMFDLEECGGCDYLEVERSGTTDVTRYGNGQGNDLHGLQLGQADNLAFHIDFTVGGNGFEICLSATPPTGRTDPSPPPAPPPEPPSSPLSPWWPFGDSCADEWCSSPDGYGGTDCWAGSEWEPCSCLVGMARTTGETTDYEGDTYYRYECCTSGANLGGESCGDYDDRNDDWDDPDEAVETLTREVSQVVNPWLLVPALFTGLFLILGAVLALKWAWTPSIVTLILGSICGFVGAGAYAIATFAFLVYASFWVGAFKSAFHAADVCGVGDDSHQVCKCIDDTQAMFASTGVGCLIGTIGFIMGAIAAICAACGVCAKQKALKDAVTPGAGGTEMAAAVATAVPAAVATAVPVAQPQAA